MSDPDMYEEYERNIHRNTVFHDGKAADGRTIDSEYPERKGVKNTAVDKKKNGGEVTYEVDDEGNLSKAAVSYNIDGRQYTVSLAVNGWGFGQDHIRLEIRRKSKNLLQNLFKNNLLASSVTPIRIPAYHKGCLWSHLRNKEIQYPSDPHYKGLVDAAFADIKGMSHEIEEKMDYMAHYEDRMREENRQRNKQNLLEQNREEQAKLKGKNHKDLQLIKSLLDDRANKR